MTIVPMSFTVFVDGTWVELGELRFTDAVVASVSLDERTKAIDRHAAAFAENKSHSVHFTRSGLEFWVVTKPDGSATTVLLPEEF